MDNNSNSNNKQEITFLYV